jgi:hypothetical protein
LMAVQFGRRPDLRSPQLYLGPDHRRVYAQTDDTGASSRLLAEPAQKASRPMTEAKGGPLPGGSLGRKCRVCRVRAIAPVSLAVCGAAVESVEPVGRSEVWCGRRGNPPLRGTYNA